MNTMKVLMSSAMVAGVLCGTLVAAEPAMADTYCTVSTNGESATFMCQSDWNRTLDMQIDCSNNITEWLNYKVFRRVKNFSGYRTCTLGCDPTSTMSTRVGGSTGEVQHWCG